jgi:hypothetical protein
MLGVDTNVVVRLLVADDIGQTHRARRLPVFMPPLSARGSVPRIHWMSGSAARLKAMTHSR